MRQAAVSFHVADFSFDRAAAVEIGEQFWCQAAPCDADQHAGLQDTVAPIPMVDDGKVGALIGQDLDLLQRQGQGVAVVRVAGEVAHSDDEALIQRRCNTDIAAKLVAHPRLALRDAVDLGLVQRIDLFATLGRLMQQVRHQDELV